MIHGVRHTRASRCNAGDEKVLATSRGALISSRRSCPFVFSVECPVQATVAQVPWLQVNPQNKQSRPPKGVNRRW
ncbi:hypothetical protein CEXT_613401 [Caerostris extrusa]|uniref:Uncharacterized protein n=1 Tax=Caerostris extrusa TaxID=172846 RepID=A0AAV4RAC6_CAEEX|nr:hypothetical protein CEXT_613401 [Caerostris extrusa]